MSPISNDLSILGSLSSDVCSVNSMMDIISSYNHPITKGNQKTIDVEDIRMILRIHQEGTSAEFKDTAFLFQKYGYLSADHAKKELEKQYTQEQIFELIL